MNTLAAYLFSRSSFDRISTKILYSSSSYYKYIHSVYMYFVMYTVFVGMYRFILRFQNIDLNNVTWLEINNKQNKIKQNIAFFNKCKEQSLVFIDKSIFVWHWFNCISNILKPCSIHIRCTSRTRTRTRSLLDQNNSPKKQLVINICQSYLVCLFANSLLTVSSKIGIVVQVRHIHGLLSRSYLVLRKQTPATLFPCRNMHVEHVPSANCGRLFTS